MELAEIPGMIEDLRQRIAQLEMGIEDLVHWQVALTARQDIQEIVVNEEVTELAEEQADLADEVTDLAEEQADLADEVAEQTEEIFESEQVPEESGDEQARIESRLAGNESGGSGGATSETGYETREVINLETVKDETAKPAKPAGGHRASYGFSRGRTRGGRAR
jgi:chromosome segregation ATPase